MVNSFEMPLQKRKAEVDQASLEAGLELAKIFNSYASGKERIGEILKITKSLIAQLENGNDVIENLRSCELIEEENQFVAKALLILKPLIDLKNDRAGEIGRDREFIKINGILSYGLERKSIHIHVVTDEKVENLLSEFGDGMKKLAQITLENDEVEEITATSWIVAAHPRVLERFGFVIDGEISEEERIAHFAGDNRPIWKASMTREKLLEKYFTE